MDAKADDGVVAVAGWLPTRNRAGVLDPKCSPWFAVQLNPLNAPWAFSKGGQPFRVIAALELLATTLALALFSAARPERFTAPSTAVVSGWTDNRGSTFAVDRLMTTKFPLCCVVMELASQLERAGLRLGLRWVPREWNKEADALTNGDLSVFSNSLRVQVDVATMKWLVLPELLSEGLRFQDEVAAVRAELGSGKRAKKSRMKRVPLRERDPW